LRWRSFQNGFSVQAIVIHAFNKVEVSVDPVYLPKNVKKLEQDRFITVI
jgi:hypothetical protein